MAVYELKESGVFSDGLRAFSSRIVRPCGADRPIEGTPWTLRHEDIALVPLEADAVEGNRVRLSNPARGTDVVQLDVSKHDARLRFAGLSDPRLRAEAARLVLYEGESKVAEVAAAWTDADDRRGVLARATTDLSGPAADAAAILLFHLHAVPPVRLPSESTTGVPIETFHPDRVPARFLLMHAENLPLLFMARPFVAPAPPLGF